MSKKVLVVAIMVAMVSVLFVGCGSSSDKKDDKVVKIGIVQLVEHPSLDQIRTETVKQLKADGYVDGENIEIVYKNAQNDQNNLKTIVDGFVSQKVDVIVPITTPAAQAAYGATKDIPIVFAAVTDPVEAGLVKSYDETTENVTGVSDRVSAERIMDLANEITPNIKSIGLIRNSGEANSKVIADELKDYAKKNGMTVIDSTVINSSEVQQATQYLVSKKVDIAFTGIDNTIASAMPVINKELIEAKIPFYVGADSMVGDGGLATCGIDYTELGQSVGKMVEQVIEGTPISDIPVIEMTDLSNYVNTETAKKIGITIPEDVLKNATIINESITSDDE